MACFVFTSCRIRIFRRSSETSERSYYPARCNSTVWATSAVNIRKSALVGCQGIQLSHPEDGSSKFLRNGRSIYNIILSNNPKNYPSKNTASSIITACLRYIIWSRADNGLNTRQIHTTLRPFSWRNPIQVSLFSLNNASYPPNT